MEAVVQQRSLRYGRDDEKFPTLFGGKLHFKNQKIPQILISFAAFKILNISYVSSS